MRRSLLIFLVAGIITLAPLSVSAAETGFFGPIVPEVCNCAGANSAPDWGCALQTLQNLVRFAISIAVVIVTLVAAYAGILLITSPFNAENRSKAKNMLMSAVIGLVITLTAWLIVDFVMKALYNETEAAAKYGVSGMLPWEEILGAGATQETMCLTIRETPAGQGPGGLQAGAPSAPDGVFTYQAGISAQAGHASAQLNSLLTCMANKVPRDVGQISSISDSMIVNGEKSFAQCAAGECVHKKNSCHYGGSRCTGKSYAVDFGDEKNMSSLQIAAGQCGASRILDEGNHLHVSVGEGCGCDGD